MVLVGPSGLRQDDGAADGRRARGRSPSGEIRDRRRGGERRRAAASATSRWCSRTTRCTRTCRCSRTSPSRCAARVQPRRRSASASSARPRSSASTRLLERQAAHPVGRAAPARRDGPRDRPRAAGVPDGRAAVEPRRQAARADARGDRRVCSAELGVTTIYVTHDQVEAMTMGTRIAVMRKGVLQQHGAAAGALRRARRTCSSRRSSARRR